MSCLNAGILGVSTYKRWRAMNLVALGATIVLLAVWFAKSYRPEFRGTVVPFLSINFLIFIGISCFYALLRKQSTDWADLTYILGATGAYSTCALLVLPGDPVWERATLAFALSAFFSLLAWAGMVRVREDRGLLTTTFGLAAAFLTLGFPLYTGGHPLAMAWAVEAVVVVALGLRLARWELKAAGIGVWLLAACVTTWVDISAPLSYGVPLLNERGALYGLMALTGAAITWLYLRVEKGVASGGTADHIAIGAALAVHALIARETYGEFSVNHWTGSDWQAGAWTAIVALWAVASLGIYTVGVLANLGFTRKVAVFVLGGGALAATGLGVHSASADWPPLANLRFVAAVVVCLSMASAAWARRKWGTAISSAAYHTLVAATSLLAAITLSQEAWSAARQAAWPELDTWQLGAWFAVAVVCAGCCAGYVALGRRAANATLRWAGVSVGAAGALIALGTSVPSHSVDWTPVLNSRGLAFALVLGATALAGWIYSRNRADLTDDEEPTLTPGLFAVSAVLILLWGITIELFQAFRISSPDGEGWQLAAFFALAGIWAVVGATAVLFGLGRRLPALRWTGVLAMGSATVIALGASTQTGDLAWTPFVNWRCLAFAVILGATALIGTVYSRREADLTLGEREPLSPSLFAVTGTLLLGWAASVEVLHLHESLSQGPGREWVKAAWAALACLWAVLGVTSLGIGFRWRMPALRWVAASAGAASALVAIGISTVSADAPWAPFVNFRFLAFALAVSAAAVAGVLYGSRHEETTEGEQGLLTPVALATTGALLALWGLSVETFHVFRWNEYPSPDAWRYAGHVAISVLWTLYAGGWMLVGVSFRRSIARWMSLGLFGLSVAKLVFYDLSFLQSFAHRAISFGVASVVLLGVAYLYSRYGAELGNQSSHGEE